MIQRDMTTVLLVDDDPGFLSVAARLMEAIGLRVTATAEDAAGALAAANEHRPDAALVDIGLPDRDGGDLARDLLALPWAPRIVLTSTDPDARGPDGVPFVPKDKLPNAPLRRMLGGDDA
jgi:CheY-like chemotaxis protein